MPFQPIWKEILCPSGENYDNRDAKDYHLIKKQILVCSYVNITGENNSCYLK